MGSTVLPSDLFTAGLSQADAIYSGGKVLPQVNLFWKHPHRTFLRQVPYLIPDSSQGQPVLTISACLVYRCQPYGQPCTCGALSGSPPLFFACILVVGWERDPCSPPIPNSLFNSPLLVLQERPDMFYVVFCFSA